MFGSALDRLTENVRDVGSLSVAAECEAGEAEGREMPAPAAPGAGTATLYPNPASGRVTVQLSPEFDGQSGLRGQLVNALGVVVRDQPWQGRTAEIALDRLPAGLYSFRLLRDATVLHVVKLAVVNR